MSARELTNCLPELKSAWNRCIPGDTWNDADLTFKIGMRCHAVRNSSIYFLINGGVILYIGSTCNLPARVVGHATTRMFDGFAYVDGLPLATAREYERRLIADLMPIWNRRIDRPEGRGVLFAVNPRRMEVSK